MGSEFLQQAFMLLGCKIPARRELAGKYLEAAYQLVKARVDKELHVAVGATALLMALATDGWRKRAAAQGAPLVNAMLLMPNIQMLNVKRIKRCIPCIHTVYILLYVYIMMEKRFNQTSQQRVRGPPGLQPKQRYQH